MKMAFDDQRWQWLQDDLNVAQLCGENAGKVYGYAKAAVQQAVAAISGDRDVTPDEAQHCLQSLRALRNGAQDAAQGYAAAVALIDDLIGRMEPPADAKPRRRAAV